MSADVNYPNMTVTVTLSREDAEHTAIRADHGAVWSYTSTPCVTCARVRDALRAALASIAPDPRDEVVRAAREYVRSRAATCTAAIHGPDEAPDSALSAEMRALGDLAAAIRALPAVEGSTTARTVSEVCRAALSHTDRVKRVLGCQCHQEEGDSPCPVHGTDEPAPAPRVGRWLDAEHWACRCVGAHECCCACAECPYCGTVRPPKEVDRG